MSDEASIRVPTLDNGTITFEQLDKNTQDRFLRNEILVYSILIIVAITLVSMVLGATAIILDQQHFNNALYRDGYYHPSQIRTVQVPPANDPAGVFKVNP
ncbi:MAG: hypothetical protein JWO96_843 [Candidatus Saccharibacteria bacterium]|nr:hypothetical protein [Candidatus Saccharibacteria bacterium]